MPRVWGAPLIDHYSGFMGPLHPLDLDDVKEDYAPLFFLMRQKYGSFGSFDVGKLVTEEGSSAPNAIRERELMELIHKCLLAVRYVGFDQGFVDKELWHDFARNMKKMRWHAHSCLRIEAVVMSPTDQDCQKMSKRGGVFCSSAVQCLR